MGRHPTTSILRSLILILMSNQIGYSRHWLRLNARIFVWASFFIYSSALAMEPIAFNVTPGPINKIQLENYFKALTPPKTAYDLAEIDLNEDGLHEFIARTSCKDDKTCDYHVLAQNNDHIIELGLIPARNIALGSAYSGGVRNIIAYKSGDNDFTSTLYVWEPGARRYMIKE
jgi:hypothetical protein